MRPPNHGHRWLVFALFLVAATEGWTADWPGWRGLRRDGYVPAGVAVPTNLPAEPKILWRSKAGNGVASPVVAGHTAYYSDNQDGQEMLHAVDTGTFQERWRVPVDVVSSDTQSPSGPRCTPLADGDHVYAQSCRGELRCLSATNGATLWHVSFTKDFGAIFMGETGNAAGGQRHGYTASPVIDGDRLFAGVSGTNGAGMVCFDKRTGKMLWKSQSDQAAYAAPIITTIAGEKQLVAFTVEGLIGLAPEDGRLLWRVPLQTRYGRHAATPVVVGDMVVVSSHELGLLGIKVSQSGRDWTATAAWTNKECAVNYSSLVAVGGHLFGVGPQKNLICVEAATGKQIWSQSGCITTSAEKAHAGLIVMGPNILMLTDSGQLFLFAATATSFREISRTQVGGFNWCNPAYADGKLFLRDNKDFLCAELLP